MTRTPLLGMRKPKPRLSTAVLDLSLMVHNLPIQKITHMPLLQLFSRREYLRGSSLLVTNAGTFDSHCRGLEFVLDRDMVVDTTLVGTVLNGLVQVSQPTIPACPFSPSLQAFQSFFFAACLSLVYGEYWS